MNLNLPYRPESAICYARLKETRPVFQEGFDQMQAEAVSLRSVQDRLPMITEIHMETIAESRKEPSKTTWNEEDIFVCCAFDLLHGLFAKESERIAADSQANKSDKQKKLRQLLQLLDNMPFTGPSWGQGTKPAIRKQLEAGLHEL